MCIFLESHGVQWAPWGYDWRVAPPMQEISYMQECLDLIIGAGATWAGGGRGPPPSPLQETRASPTKDAFLESTYNAKFPRPAVADNALKSNDCNFCNYICNYWPRNFYNTTLISGCHQRPSLQALVLKLL